MIRTLARLALAAAAGGVLWSLRRQYMPQETERQPKTKAPSVQIWEGEGGALPETGSQVGPDPVQAVGEVGEVGKSAPADAGRWPA